MCVLCTSTTCVFKFKRGAHVCVCVMCLHFCMCVIVFACLCDLCVFVLWAWICLGVHDYFQEFLDQAFRKNIDHLLTLSREMSYPLVLLLTAMQRRPHQHFMFHLGCVPFFTWPFEDLSTAVAIRNGTKKAPTFVCCIPHVHCCTHSHHPHQYHSHHPHHHITTTTPHHHHPHQYHSHHPHHHTTPPSLTPVPLTSSTPPHHHHHTTTSSTPVPLTSSTSVPHPRPRPHQRPHPHPRLHIRAHLV